MYKNISPLLMPYANKILPLAYDESLSYYEQLLVVKEKVNELIKIVNEQYEEILKEVDTNVKKRLVELEIVINSNMKSLKDSLENELSNFNDNLSAEIIRVEKERKEQDNYLQSELSELRDSSESEFSRLQNEIVKLNVSITKLYNDFNLYILATDGEIDRKIEKAVRDLQDLITENLNYTNGKYIIVFNPLQGKSTSLNDCLKDLLKVYTFYTLTAKEYDSLELTAEEFDKMELTAEKYDTIARFIFIKELYFKEIFKSIKETFLSMKEEIISLKNNFLMRNPFTGSIVDFKIVINHLVNFHKENALTCSEFDEKEKTANEIDRLQLNSYEFDFYSKTLLI